MKNIKSNTSISDFDDFLCKLEEKEEFGCFIIRQSLSCSVCTGNCSVVCMGNILTNHNGVTDSYGVTDSNGVVIVHDTVDGQDDEYELATEDDQDDEYESDTEDEQDDQI